MIIDTIDGRTDALFVLLLADRFAQEMRDYLQPWQWDEMRRRNATTDYQGGCCASHDFCDANMAMMAAFEAVFGRDPAFSEDEDQQARDLELINPAWSIAKIQNFTAGV